LQDEVVQKLQAVNQERRIELKKPEFNRGFRVFWNFASQF